MCTPQTNKQTHGSQEKKTWIFFIRLGNIIYFIKINLVTIGMANCIYRSLFTEETGGTGAVPGSPQPWVPPCPWPRKGVQPLVLGQLLPAPKFPVSGPPKACRAWLSCLEGRGFGGPEILERARGPKPSGGRWLGELELGTPRKGIGEARRRDMMDPVTQRGWDKHGARRCPPGWSDTHTSIQGQTLGGGTQACVYMDRHMETHTLTC